MLLLPRELPAGGAPLDGVMVDLMDGGRMEEGRKFLATGKIDEGRRRRQEAKVSLLFNGAFFLLSDV